MFVEDLSFFDLVLSLCYSALALWIVFMVKSKKKRSSARLLLPFVTFKILCAYVFVLIHIYVYRGGDTFLYFAGSKLIANSILHSPENVLNYLFGSYEEIQIIPYSKELPILRSFKSENTLFQSRLTSIFTLLSFGNFASTTILVSLFSASGIWLMYKAMSALYPPLYKHFSYVILFFPTIGIWSSGILKDTFTLAGLGFIFFGMFLVIERKKYIKALLLITLGIYLNLMLKAYILYIFVPAMLIWYHGHIVSSIKNRFTRLISTPVLLILIMVASFFFVKSISSSAGKYSVENAESLAVGFHEWHTYLAETREQSGYSLGKVEFTLWGVIAKAPQSLVVTFFRPYPFEVKNSAMLLESIESSLLLLITIFVLYKVGLFNALSLIVRNKHLRAFLFFAIIFGIVVGFTSYNFGALSRYKIPCIPFYGASLAILWYLGKKKKSNRTTPAYLSDQADSSYPR